jgi:hypothetical protein
MTIAVEGVRLEARTPGKPVANEPARAPPSRTQGSDFSRMWRQLGREIDRGEGLLGAARQPAVRQMDAGTLIALQAGIYRYGEAIDLTVKLVDRASSAIRTILESGR